MALWAHRLPDDLAARFDALAMGQGGRSSLIRRLIQNAVDGAANRSTTGAVATEPGVQSDKITVRFRREEVAAIDRAARQAGLRQTQWLVALVRARLSSTVPMPEAERLSIRALAAEFRGVVAGLRAAIRTTEEALREASTTSAEIDALEAQLAVAGDLEGRLRGLLQRNLASWTGEGTGS